MSPLCGTVRVHGASDFMVRLQSLAALDSISFSILGLMAASNSMPTSLTSAAPQFNEEEAVWCAARLADVVACLQQRALAHGRVGDGPAWHVMPYASIWAVERASRPEWIGWWVICGDLPTDAVSAQALPQPRDAMREFANRWLLHGDQLDRGLIPAAWAHLPHDAMPALAAQLKKRGAALQLWADDAAAWPDCEADTLQAD
jgi:hypothetical protein